MTVVDRKGVDVTNSLVVEIVRETVWTAVG